MHTPTLLKTHTVKHANARTRNVYIYTHAHCHIQNCKRLRRERKYLRAFMFMRVRMPILTYARAHVCTHSPTYTVLTLNCVILLIVLSY